MRVHAFMCIIYVCAGATEVRGYWIPVLNHLVWYWELNLGPRRAVSSLNCRDIPQPQMTILIEWHWQPSHMAVLLKVVSLCPQGWGQEPVRKLPFELLGCLLCFSHQKSLVSPVSLALWITESNSGHWSSVRCCSTYEHLAIPGDIFIFHDSVLWVSQCRKYGVQKSAVAWYRAQSLGRGVLKSAWTICSSESCL